MAEKLEMASEEVGGINCLNQKRGDKDLIAFVFWKPRNRSAH